MGSESSSGVGGLSNSAETTVTTTLMYEHPCDFLGALLCTGSPHHICPVEHYYKQDMQNHIFNTASLKLRHWSKHALQHWSGSDISRSRLRVIRSCSTAMFQMLFQAGRVALPKRQICHCSPDVTPSLSADWVCRQPLLRMPCEDAIAD